MRAGQLNRRVTLQRRVETPSGTGGSTVSWQEIGGAWANIKHQSGAEVNRSDVPVSGVKASIRVRWRTDLDATCRVVYGSDLYDIKAVIEDLAGREFVDLVCEKGVNRG